MFLQPNKTSEYDFTIIVPVYNEEDNMEAVEKRLAAYLPAASRRACVLFVDDCSTDRSLALIKEICARNEHFYYIAFARNGGLSAALKAGIDYAWSPLVGYIDSDLQTAPEDFFTGMHRFLPALIQLQNGRVIQMPVRHFPRVAGKSKYHLWNRLAGPFKDCFAYRWMRKRYINYDVNGGNL